MEKDKLSPFTIANSILYGKELNLTDKEFEKINMFVVMRYLVTDFRLFEDIDFINNVAFSNKLKILLLQDSISSRRIKKYNCYFPKTEKGEEDVLLNIIIRRYNISEETALILKNNMSVGQKNNLLKIYS